ncbi:hypothetical protein [Methylobacterium oryzisoli]|uniref:hypothetical protein n=1 Tax=Methylobacterium oryzisoli TaxID=3385502 RepID=UPI003892350D
MGQSRFRAGEAFAGAQGADSLVLHLRRLVQHRGYDRSLIVSEVLRRLLAPGFGGAPSPDDLRARLAATSPDPKVRDYLTRNVALELDAAHARSAGRARG